MAEAFNNQFNPGNRRPDANVQQNNAGVQWAPQRQQYASNSAQRPQTGSAPRYAANSTGYRVPTSAPAAQVSVQSSAAMASVAPAAPAAPASDTALRKTANGAPVNKQEATPNKGSKLSAYNVSTNKTNYKEDSLKLDFSEDNLLKGLIMSEILGRPKCFRRGR